MAKVNWASILGHLDTPKLIELQVREELAHKIQNQILYPFYKSFDELRAIYGKLNGTDKDVICAYIDELLTANGYRVGFDRTQEYKKIGSGLFPGLKIEDFIKSMAKGNAAKSLKDILPKSKYCDHKWVEMPSIYNCHKCMETHPKKGVV